jgi:hypothetical protein
MLWGEGVGMGSSSRGSRPSRQKQKATKMVEIRSLQAAVSMSQR